MGFEIDNIASIIGEELKNTGKTICSAESCTGGFISHLITSNPGASQYYKGSVIAYSNEIKQSLLDVSFENLQTYGAVSKQVAEEMSKGALKRLQTTYAVATTGIAGPEGGSEEKPVGIVWISVSSDKKTISEKYYFPTTRDNFIERTSNQALLMLLKLIKEGE
jgi:nicotinamide-nucleotide amidase